MEVEMLEPGLGKLVRDGEWERTAGTSRAETWRVHFEDGRPAVFVKLGVAVGATAAVEAEAERWEWLQSAVAGARRKSRPPVPALLGWQRADAGLDRPAAMVTAAAEGVPEIHWLVAGNAAAELLGSALREVHRLPVGSCPFTAGPRHLLEAAAQRVHAGMVDPAKFHAANQRYSPIELLSHAEALLAPDPEGDDRVVVHGDWSLGNLIVDPETTGVAALVDWGGLGVGDRHFDLATGARSLAGHFGPEVLPAFLGAYGFEDPDALRLEFYSLIDQFR